MSTNYKCCKDIKTEILYYNFVYFQQQNNEGQKDQSFWLLRHTSGDVLQHEYVVMTLCPGVNPFQCSDLCTRYTETQSPDAEKFNEAEYSPLFFSSCLLHKQGSTSTPDFQPASLTDVMQTSCIPLCMLM